MQVNIYKSIGNNSGVLEKTKEIINVKSGRWIFKEVSHPMNYKKKFCFKNQNVYYLHKFGDDKKEPHQGYFISLNFWQNQRFLFLQRAHWLQQEENIRYIINMSILTIGVATGICNYLKQPQKETYIKIEPIEFNK